MRNGRTWVKYTVAQKIAKYLWETVKYPVNPLDLILPRERNELKSLFFSFKHHSIKSMSIPMSHVKCDFQAPYLIEQEQRPLNQLRSIIIDENNQLIANEETYFLYKIQYKKTIPVWKLSLLDLQNGKYALGDLKKAFDLIERTAIGISLEKFIGNRQGKRTDLDKLVENYPQVSLPKGAKTRNIITALLSFGSDYTYRQLKKILQHGCAELIDQVRHKKIAVSHAAKRIELSHNQ
jgi:hypothetical protein